MNEQQAKENIPTTRTRHRIIQNFQLIWLGANIGQSNILAQLQNVVSDVNVFTQPDKCVDFFIKLGQVKAVLIADGMLGQQVIPLIHDVSQLDIVYIFCRNKSRYGKWSKNWLKINGVYTDIEPICQSLRQVVKQNNQDSIPMSFVAVGEQISSQNLNQLEPSFMYTQIFKEILLEMKYDEQSIERFTDYCRNNKYGSLSNIIRFKNEYNAQLAIWWYTYPSFIYSLLNSALRLLEAETIINTGFFIHDLHRQLEQLHHRHISNYDGKPFTVYRGQGLSTVDFEKFRRTKGGLMSFNNFLSTSKEKEVSLSFAKSALKQSDTIGIFFQMTIDPSISSTLFARINEGSYFNEKEDEILFSMHTVFRIGDIKQIDHNNSLYQVELKLTADNDKQFRALTKRVRQETGGDTG